MKTGFSGPQKLHRNLIFFSALLGALLFSVWARAGQTTLVWDPNAESNLAGYKVHYGTASRNYSVHQDVQNLTSYTLTGLSAGKTYYFATTAYDTSGNESGYSNEVSFSLPNSNPTRPSVPSGPSKGLLNSVYSFSTSATDPDGHSLQYRYDWGGGVVSIWGEANQNNTWKQAGFYGLKVQARDSEGALSAWSPCRMVMISVSSKDSDGDGIPDDLEISHFGTDPNLADSDGDGISDEEEIAIWGQSWSDDIDGDEVINLLDWDSDGDGFSDGEELAKGTDLGDKNSKVAALPMEAGEVTINHNWKKVSFSRQFFNPVVVAGGMSANDPQAAVVRIRNVNSSGFEIRIQEWDCYDRVHAEETVGYLVVESGVHALANNLQVEAGQFIYRRKGQFFFKSFQQAFSEPPVVIGSVASFRDPAAASVRFGSITSQGFKLRLQEQEANVQDHGDERISYIAWQPSSGNFNGIVFEVDRTEPEINHRFSPVQFTEPHSATPVFVGQMQTHHGGNAAILQWQGKGTEEVKLRVAEETSRDEETAHVKEVVGFMAFSTIQ